MADQPVVRQGVFLGTHRFLKTEREKHRSAYSTALLSQTVFANAYRNMIPLREFRLESLDTGGQDSPPAESPGSNLGDEKPDTAGLVAAVNHEIDSAAVPVSATADVTPPRATDDHTLEPASSSHRPTDQETCPRQPEAKSNLSRFLEKISLTSTTLGFVVAIILGAISWSGLNYANYYAKKSYDLALYQACRSYEVRSSQSSNTSFFKRSRKAGLTNLELYRIFTTVQRVELLSLQGLESDLFPTSTPELGASLLISVGLV